MVAIALVRGISAGVIGTNNYAWTSFWVQIEASISVTTACPIAFRSVFLLNHKSKNSPNRDRGNEGQRSTRGNSWRRVSPCLPGINVGATLTGMRTIIGKSQLQSRDVDGYALSSTATQGYRSSPSLETSERGAKVVDQPLGTMVWAAQQTIAVCPYRISCWVLRRLGGESCLSSNVPSDCSVSACVKKVTTPLPLLLLLNRDRVYIILVSFFPIWARARRPGQSSRIPFLKLLPK